MKKKSMLNNRIDKRRGILAFVLVMLTIIGVFLGRGTFNQCNIDKYNETGELQKYELSSTPVEQAIVLKGNIREVDIIMYTEDIEKVSIYAELVDESGQILSSCAKEVPSSDEGKTDVALELKTDGLEGQTDAVLRIRLGEELGNVKYAMSSVQYERSINVAAVIWFIAEIVLVIALLLIPREWKKLENIFVAFAIVFGCFFAVFNPPLQECDGLTHFYKVIDVSYGNVLAPFVNVNHEYGLVRVPENFSEKDWAILNGGQHAAKNQIDLLKGKTFSKGTKDIVDYGYIPSFAYWAQGLGIWIGRTLHQSQYICVVLARIFNLLTYTAIVYVAIRRMPIYKNFMTAVALMPLALYQAASVSQDAILYALCFLFVSLCFSYAFGESEELSWRQMLGLGCILTLIFMIKYVYVTLGLLVFMIPMKKFGSKKRYWITFVISILPLMIFGGYQILHTASGIVSTQSVSVDGGITQVEFIKSRPLFLLKVLCLTILTQSAYYVESLNVLGSIDCPLTLLIVTGPCFLVLIGALDGSNACCDEVYSVKNRLLAFFSFVICTVLIFVGLYISDGKANSVGAAVVSGVQGRYFVQLLILLLIAFAGRNIKNEIKDFSLKMSGIIGVMLVYATYVLYKTYY